MKTKELLAYISHQFFKDQKVNRYRMKKVVDMTDDEVISSCHSYCEENNLNSEWHIYRENIESQYCYCSYLEEYIDEGLCYDLQMITSGLIKPSSLPDIIIDKDKCSTHCSKCKYCF